jgi:hypothetical protein
MNEKKLYRLYTEERLAVKRRKGRKRTRGPSQPLPPAAAPNARWSLDFVSDTYGASRRFRILAVVDAQCFYWLVVIAGCAAWTVFSIYHAIPLIAGHQQAAMGALSAPAYIAFGFLAFSLIFHEWALDRIERAPLKPSKSSESAGESTKPADAPMPSPALMRPPVQKTRPRSPIRKQRANLRVVFQNAGIAAAVAAMGWTPKDKAGFEQVATIACRTRALGAKN